MDQKRTKADSLDAMGLQAFMDDRYYKYGGYVKLKEMLEAGADNAEIARHFERTTRHAARPWRAKWEAEKLEATEKAQTNGQ